jgi:hypothetical protein
MILLALTTRGEPGNRVASKLMSGMQAIHLVAKNFLWNTIDRINQVCQCRVLSSLYHHFMALSVLVLVVVWLIGVIASSFSPRPDRPSA